MTSTSQPQNTCYTCGTDHSTLTERWTDTGDLATQVLDQLGYLPWYCTPCAAKYETKYGFVFAVVVPEPAYS